jgi:hypothetical protein
MLKAIMIIGFCCFYILGNSQNINELLTHNDKQILKDKGTLFKSIDSTDRKMFDGFTGKLKITQIDNEFQFSQLGQWERINYDNNFDALMNYDSSGMLINYKDFNKNGVIIFDCNYQYEKNADFTFRIEELKLFYDNGILRQKGWRYNKILIKEEKNDMKAPKKFGIWEYYDTSGKLIKTKSFGNYN